MKLLNFFKRNRTKWMPLGNYEHAGVDYITFVRKNPKNGMLYFKTKRVNTNNPMDTQCYSIFKQLNIIDTKKAWNEITKKRT